MPPFAIRQPDGSWTGISIERWEAIAAELGWQTGSPLREPFNRELLRLLYEPDWRARLADYSGGQ